MSLRPTIRKSNQKKWEKLKTQFVPPALKDEQGMYTMPLLDALIRERQWICPIYPRESDSAYYRRGEGCHIIVPLKGQFDTGESFYSTLLHEMAHSTGEAGHLEREKGEIFGDSKYAKDYPNFSVITNFVIILLWENDLRHLFS